MLEKLVQNQRDRPDRHRGSYENLVVATHVALSVGRDAPAGRRDHTEDDEFLPASLGSHLRLMS